METATVEVSDVNLGLYDGEVSHERINAAVARGRKTVLFGEQTRLPYFPYDDRLPKLPANDPLVLLFLEGPAQDPRESAPGPDRRPAEPDAGAR